MTDILDVGIAAIIGREVLEGAIIVMQYRTIIKRANEWEGERKKKALQTVTKSAVLASIVAIVIVACVAIPLIYASRRISKKAVSIIEGVSKLVAAVCVLQLSLKVPVWFELYPRKPKANSTLVTDGSLREISFNVAWNIWREVAECGVFLIPYFLGDNVQAIPLSAAVGIVSALIFTWIIFAANKRLTNKLWLVVSLSFLTGILSVGLFVGGCNSLEHAFGETKIIWTIHGDFWDQDKFPMTLIEPFGYSSTRTALQCAAFWLWSALCLALHAWKYSKSKQYAQDVEKGRTPDAPAEDVEQSLRLSQENSVAIS